MNERKQRRNTYRLAGHDYGDPSYAYFITLSTQIKTVKGGAIHPAHARRGAWC